MKYTFGKVVAVLLALCAIGFVPQLWRNNAVAQDKTELVYPYGAVPPTDPELKNLQWNRYTTENFTILSIDDGQGKWLHQNMEQIRKWCLSRWGFPDFKFTKECRVFCVPNKQLMKKLFNLQESRFEIRRKNGQIEITAMWLVLDDKPAKVIPTPLTQICLAEFEARYGTSVGFWAKRGMSMLNGTVPEIRGHIQQLSGMVLKDQPMFVSQKMFTMTEEEYFKEKAENQRIYDQQAVALCLMLRKEFGEAKLQGFLRISSKNNAEDVMRVVYGFQSFAHFDKSYFRYMRDLANDVNAGKTPDSYLEIVPVSK